MLEPIAGRCTMPWHVFAGLAKVRALAPTPADREDLQLTLRRAGLIAGGAVDVERAGLAVLRWEAQRRAATIPPRLKPAAKPRRSRQRQGRRSAGAVGYYNPLTGLYWNPAAGGWQ